MANYNDEFLYSELDPAILAPYIEWYEYSTLPTADNDHFMQMAILTTDEGTKKHYICTKEEDAYEWRLVWESENQVVKYADDRYFTITDHKLLFNSAFWDLVQTTSTSYTKSEVDSLTTTISEDLEDHKEDIGNPHKVTKAQVGLSDVENIAPTDMPISTYQQAALDDKQDKLVSGTNIKTVDGESIIGAGDLTTKYAQWGNISGIIDTQTDLAAAFSTRDTNIAAVQTNLDTHIADTNNPHNVTKAQVGLDKVENIAPKDMPVSDYVNAELDTIKLEKQSVLVSGYNIKTVDGQTILGGGDLTTKNATWGKIDGAIDDQTDLQDAFDEKEWKLEGDDIITISTGSTTKKTKVSADKDEIKALAPVQTVAGRVGDVVLTKSDVGLSNVDNTADADKPVSTAVLAALALKQNNLTAGTNIALASDGTISSTYTFPGYTAGNEVVRIDDSTKKIYGRKYIAGTNLTIDPTTDPDVYTINAAGGGGGSTTIPWSNITGSDPTVNTALKGVLDTKQIKLTAGAGINLDAAGNISTASSAPQFSDILGSPADNTNLAAALNAKANTADLATVATSGSYADLTNKPTIPTKTSDLVNDSGFVNTDTTYAAGTDVSITGSDNKINWVNPFGTVGGTAQPVYFNSGTPTVLGTVGNANQAIYMNAGTLTGGRTIFTQSTQPTANAVGDIWIKY